MRSLNVTSFAEELNSQNRRVSVSVSTETATIEHANEPLAVLDAPTAFWSTSAGQAALPISIATPEQLRSFELVEASK
jgi:hypothetical protein